MRYLEKRQVIDEFQLCQCQYREVFFRQLQIQFLVNKNVNSGLVTTFFDFSIAKIVYLLIMNANEKAKQSARV